MIISGIDTSAGKDKNTGHSRWCTKQQQLLDVSSSSAWVAQKTIMELHDQYGMQFGVMLEDLTMDKCNFRGSSNKGIMARMGRDVGKNMGICILLKQMMDDLGILYLCIAPSQRDNYKKTNKRAIHSMRWPTKMPSKEFKQMTGYLGSTNEHGRDGATLVYGMTEPKFRMLVAQQRNPSMPKKTQTQFLNRVNKSR